MNDKQTMTEVEESFVALSKRFTELKRHYLIASDRTIWSLRFDGKRVDELTSDDLFSFKRFRNRIAEQCSVLLPMMKATGPFGWERIVEQLFNPALRQRNGAKD